MQLIKNNHPGEQTYRDFLFCCSILWNCYFQREVQVEFALNLWRENKAVDNLRHISWQIISPSSDTPSAPRPPTISGYNGSERNADDHDTLVTNLEVNTLSK